MKICPKCQSKYTDDSLNYCLQDGDRLDEFVDDKTLVLDAESFANQATITEKIGGEFGAADTNENSHAKETSAPESASVETLIKPSEGLPVENRVQGSKSGVGFMFGVVIALLLVGMVGAGFYILRSYTNSIDSNSNTNSSGAKDNMERTLNDSPEVKVSSSSTRKSDKGNFYNPQMAFDGNPRTAWCEGARGAGLGQWIAFDFKKEVTLRKIIIQPGYFKTDELWRKNNRLKSAYIEFSGKPTKVYEFNDEMKEQTIDVEGVKTKSVMIKIKQIYPGASDSKDTLISEVSFVVE